MRYRQFGQTGLTVSEIGFGAWGIGGWTPGQLSYGRTEDEVSLAALARAFELGVTFVDTAALYGLGHSEELVGTAMKGRRDTLVVATKAGFTTYGGPADYSPSGIERSLEASLRRLDTDYVDLLQLHSPPLSLLRDEPAIIRCLDGLRKRGLVRCWGLSTNSPAEGLVAIKEFGAPAIQVNFNMLDLRALDCGLFDTVRAHGAGLIARTPLNFGFLVENIAEDTVFPPEDHRSRWNGPQVARWARAARDIMASLGARSRLERLHAALRFCLSFDAVTTVIPGILSADQAEENAAASDWGPLSPDAVRAVLSCGQNEAIVSKPSPSATAG